MEEALKGPRPRFQEGDSSRRFVVVYWSHLDQPAFVARYVDPQIDPALPAHLRPARVFGSETEAIRFAANVMGPNEYRIVELPPR